MKSNAIVVALAVGGLLPAQVPTQMVQQGGNPLGAGQDPKPMLAGVEAQGRSAQLGSANGAAGDVRKDVERAERLDQEIREARRKDKGSRRFASDLFDIRQLSGTSATEGGVTDEYVLGTGDQLMVNVFGSATFELPTQVDGRGEMVLPRIGTVKVGGLSLAKARQAVQSAVSRQFSAATVDMTVLKLREVRVQVLGEVYRSGSFLVPSLSSLVNVLSLSGGPTSLGSYRDIRVLRGGKVVHRLDLYPLRAEGLGNQNFYLQNGDHIFVPLIQNQVSLEGAFTRVQPLDWAQPYAERGSEAPKGMAKGNLRKANQSEKAGVRVDLGQEEPDQELPEDAPVREARAQALKDGALEKDQVARVGAGLLLRDAVGDQKLGTAPGVDPMVHSMLFELLPGETVATALRFAGGLHPWADANQIALRRLDGSGRLSVQDVSIAAADRVTLQRGDVLSAFPRRDVVERMVSITGHARIPGVFARTEGLRVGDLLRQGQQVLPDTYLSRGEVVRTLANGETRFLAFDVKLALQGDATHNLLLEDRDRIELFGNERMRRPEFISLQGAMAKPGRYPFHAGMRASDLVFRAGIPLKSANRFVAELARTKDGAPSVVTRLDLARLLSDEGRSPVDVRDEALNPVLQPDDQISVFEKPEFRLHRTVKILGQVNRPGTYTLDMDKPTLSGLIDRAGGLTDQAMPSAGMFFRRPGGGAGEVTGVPEQDSRNRAQAVDPAAKGVADILERLNEAKFYPVDPSGGKVGSPATFFKAPILHGLSGINLNRMVVDFNKALQKEAVGDPELLDGDEIIIPRKTDSAIVIGEVASPFAYYKIRPGMNVADLLKLAGDTTRNADRGQIRLLKADGRLMDSWVSYRKVEPGDVVLVPQRIRRDSSWQENLQALTPIALIANAVKW